MTAAAPAAETGSIYLLHFDPPYRPSPDAPVGSTAGHYRGWAKDLPARLAAHEAGRAARLTQVQRHAGGTWRVAKVEEGTRARERQLKQRGATRDCPICKGGPAVDIDPAPPAYVRPEPTPADVGVTADESARWTQNEPDTASPVPDAEPAAADPEPDAPVLPESFWAPAQPEPEPGLEAEAG
jgi:hypothetical protein